MNHTRKNRPDTGVWKAFAFVVAVEAPIVAALLWWL